MRFRLVVALVLVLGLLAGADVAARGYAEREIAARAEAAVPGAQATAHIRSFPFVLRLLVSGSVQELRVQLSPVKASRLELRGVDLGLSDLTLDRGQLFSGKVEPVGLGQGNVAFEVSEVELSKVLGRRVTIEGGHLYVDVLGQDVEARVGTSGSAITLTVAGLPLLTVPIERRDVIPCRPQ
ncbi:MAG TPA: hypothetical protein VM093_10195, partial [Aeromicrobium sp.]|nr:hypothetical protein [Aeromicrobium sp.]